MSPFSSPFRVLVMSLRKLAEHCNYGRSLNEMLCDHLVCGIANPTMQKRLLAEPDFTLDRAVSMAQAAELADKGAVTGIFVLPKNCPRIKIFRKFLSYGIIFFVLG